MTTPWSGRSTERLWKERCWDKRRMFEEFAELIPGCDGILDVGAGMGEFENHVDAQYTSIDMEPSFDPDVVGDVTDLPFDDDEYDVVTCFFVLQHIPEWEKVVEELMRVASDTVIIATRAHMEEYQEIGDDMHGEHRAILSIPEISEKMGEPDITGVSDINPRIGVFVK